ncbi:MAG: prephenate dehydratase [Bacteroidales bacterium]
MKKVTIQGVTGCFHEAAARNYFEGEEIETIPCVSFENLFNVMAKERDYYGIVAIENTIAGSLLQNNELLRSSDLQIIGEYKLRISHVLAALPGQDIGDISEVNSHPIALMQCGDFLKEHTSLKVVEKDDTAGSAKEISEKSLKGHAAICGELAADLYGLNILYSGIETNKRNFTRFLILCDTNKTDFNLGHNDINKASLVFTLPHTHGSLSKILTIFSFYDINLTKIQSLPIIGCEWEYRFYIDVTFDDYVRYRQALSSITPLTKAFKVLGEYKEYIPIEN